MALGSGLVTPVVPAGTKPKSLSAGPIQYTTPTLEERQADIASRGGSQLTTGGSGLQQETLQERQADIASRGGHPLTVGGAGLKQESLAARQADIASRGGHPLTVGGALLHSPAPTTTRLAHYNGSQLQSPYPTVNRMASYSGARLQSPVPAVNRMASYNGNQLRAMPVRPQMQPNTLQQLFTGRQPMGYPAQRMSSAVAPTTSNIAMNVAGALVPGVRPIMSMANAVTNPGRTNWAGLAASFLPRLF